MSRRASMKKGGGIDHEDELGELQKRFAAIEEEQKRDRSQQQRRRKKDDVSDTVISEERHRANLQKMDAKITNLRRLHDELAYTNHTKRQELDKLADKLADLSMTSKVLMDDSQAQQQLSEMDHALEDAFQQYDEAHEVRKTYEQVVKRLKEERVSFDNELVVLTRAMQAKEMHYEALLLMSHDANHSKELAKAQLSRFESILSDERKSREKDIAEKKQQVSKKQDDNYAMDLAEDQRHAAAISKNNQANQETVDDADIRAEQEKIGGYQRAFRQIKEVTGVSDVNEVIQKFLTQEEAHKNLLSMTKESQNRIDYLNKNMAILNEKVKHKRFDANSDLGPSQTSDAKTKMVAAVNAELERSQHRGRKLDQVWTTTKSGIAKCYELLEGARASEKPEARIVVSESNLMEVSMLLEEKLLKIQEALKYERRSEERSNMSSHAAKVLGAIRVDREKLAKLQEDQDNFRVKEQVSDEEEDSAYEEDLEDDVPDREMLKKQAATILEKVYKKTKKRRKKQASAD